MSPTDLPKRPEEPKPRLETLLPRFSLNRRVTVLVMVAALLVLGVVAAATSSGRPARPSAVSSRACCRYFSGSVAFSGVSIQPGATTLARTPKRPSSRAAVRPKAIRPALLAA